MAQHLGPGTNSQAVFREQHPVGFGRITAITSPDTMRAPSKLGSESMADKPHHPHNPHDRFFRSVMENQAVARDFMQLYLPSEISSALDLNSLTLEHDSYIDASLQAAVSDLVFRCQLAHRPAYLAVLIEHQSQPDPFMPVRMAHYLFCLLNKQLKLHPGKRLPPVYGMIFYHGRRTPYPYSLNLADCFEDPLALMKNLFHQPVPIVDVNQLSEAQLRQHRWIGIVAQALKHIRKKDLQPYLVRWLQACEELDNHGPQWLDFIKTLIHYVMSAGNVSDVNHLMAESQRLPPPIGETLMTIAEQLEARGAAKGEAQGEAKGREEALKNTATNLLREGIDPEVVARGTTLPLSVVYELKKALQP